MYAMYAKAMYACMAHLCHKSYLSTFGAFLSRKRFTRFVQKVFAHEILPTGKFGFFVSLVAGPLLVLIAGPLLQPVAGPLQKPAAATLQKCKLILRHLLLLQELYVSSFPLNPQAALLLMK